MRAGAMSSMNDSSVRLMRARLVPQERMVEIDRVGDLQLVGRIERNLLVAVAEAEGPRHPEVTAGRAQLLDAGILTNEVDERRRAAVHDRHFGLVQLDVGVVNSLTHQGGQKVLDRLDLGRPARQHGRVADASDMRDVGGNLQAPQIRASKHEPGISRRGLQRKGDLVAGVKSDAGAVDGST